ncbi:sugar phosphate nucleotidyltransferase [Bacillus gobiensis]|uniref:sugar phosphate nucleotidyltransferase n=1 Tax=Bacillus gobiensis TaxID=1441095 RepID=UPI003D1E7D3A
MKTIIIPMAGYGSRFIKEGYSEPKMLIRTAHNNASILEFAIQSFKEKLEGFRWVFVCLKKHVQEWGLANKLYEIMGDEKHIIVTVDEVTNGQLCSILKVSNWIDSQDILVIHNCDTYFMSDFKYMQYIHEYDGFIPVFKNNSTNYSYVDVDSNNIASEVIEKQVTPSRYASVGTYIFKCGADFLRGADRVKILNERINDEFYVSSVYKHLINEGKLFKAELIDGAWPIGTPEELQRFNNQFKLK